MNESDKVFLTVRQAAKELRIPASFIRAEAKAGRVPGFKSGSRTYVNLPAFRDVLIRANLRADEQ